MNCYSCHSGYKRSVTPFWFQLLTIVSSFIGTHYEHRQLLVFALWISKSLLSHWSPAIQIFRLSNLIHIPLFKLLSIFYVHSWYSYFLLRLWVFDVIECLDYFVCFSLSSRTSPFRKRSVSFFGVGLPRTVCAIDWHVPRNRVAKFYCFFLPLWKISDQTKSKSSLIGLTTFSSPLRRHTIKMFFLWSVHFDPLIKKMSDANLLSGSLRKHKFTSTGSKGHGVWFVIGGVRSVLWLSVFQGLLLVSVMMINGREKTQSWRRLLSFRGRVFLKSLVTYTNRVHTAMVYPTKPSKWQHTLFES